MKSPIETLVDSVQVHPVETHLKDMTDPSMPYVTHSGVLEIGDAKVDVHVLSNGKRVVSGPFIDRLIEGIKSLQN